MNEQAGVRAVSGLRRSVLGALAQLAPQPSLLSGCLLIHVLGCGGWVRESRSGASGKALVSFLTFRAEQRTTDWLLTVLTLHATSHRCTVAGVSASVLVDRLHELQPSGMEGHRRIRLLSGRTRSSGLGKPSCTHGSSTDFPSTHGPPGSTKGSRNSNASATTRCSTS